MIFNGKVCYSDTVADHERSFKFGHSRQISCGVNFRSDFQ
jgi:hypothetical protein